MSENGAENSTRKSHRGSGRGGRGRGGRSGRGSGGGRPRNEKISQASDIAEAVVQNGAVPNPESRQPADKDQKNVPNEHGNANNNIQQTKSGNKNSRRSRKKNASQKGSDSANNKAVEKSETVTPSRSTEANNDRLGNDDNNRKSGNRNSRKNRKKNKSNVDPPPGKSIEEEKKSEVPSQQSKASQEEKSNDREEDSKSGKRNSRKNKKSGHSKTEAPTNPYPEKTHDKNKKKQARNKDQHKGAKQAIKKPSSSSLLLSSTPPNQPQTTNDLDYAKGENIIVLHVAEKPSIAQAIAKGLAGGGSFKSRGSRLAVHEFTESSFPKAPKASRCTHRITSVAGHVFSVDFPSQYQSWDSVDPAELFHAPVVRKPCQGSVVKHLQDEAKGVNFIVLWNDCDREGENINFEVLDVCMHLMKAGGASNYDRVYRAYFSAINPSDIKKAYASLGKPDKNQSLSVDARQELDLKVGVAFSRFQTRFFQGRYGDLDSAVLSYGPCQTPTLGFCVQRHVDIETFKPEPYWALDLGILKRGRQLRAVWGSGRSFNQKKVEALVEKCRETSPPCKAVVTSVVSKDKKQGRPVPLNTVSLLKACSKALGIGPHSAMQAAERLYLQGYLSYPRTESTAYPKSFDIKGTLQSQSGDNRWGSYVRDLLKEGPNKSRGGVDMGDHPPITPCRPGGAELSGDMGRIFDLVVRHFIASVSPDAVWRSTRVDFEIDELVEHGRFSIRGKEMVKPGFLAVVLHKEYGEEAEKDRMDDDEEETTIPEFQGGEEIPLFQSSSSSSAKVAVASSAPCWATLTVKERMTTPPTHLTESELIGLMEKNGIGTDASISTHIENIMKRNYVYLETGRKLRPSKLGLVLCQGYHQIDDSLVLPKVRSDIEQQCSRIAKGQASRDDVVKFAIEFFAAKFDFFVKNISQMDVLFSSSFAKLEDVGKPFTRCGFTRRYLQYINGPPARLYNKFTESVYALPAGGIIKQWTGRKCVVEGCNFELCMYSVGQPERTFPLCPNCFNNPKPEWGKVPGDDEADSVPKLDGEDEKKERQIRRVGGKSLILECPLPDKHPLIEEMSASPDPDNDGVFILDPHFGPKWRLVSTRSPTIIYFPKSTAKITILDRKDDVLGCNLIQIDFKPGESPLQPGIGKYTCCFPSDEAMQNVVRVYHGSERTKSSSGRGGRGRRGGRGGRGRGGKGGGRSRR